MRKIVAATNITIDGFCDHTAMSPDAEVHQHYTELLNNADTILYGRITYQLMQYWQTILKTPSEEKSMNDFAHAIDKIQKIVFSKTLKDLGWSSAKLATDTIEKTVSELRQQPGGTLLVGSRSIIVALANLNLIDEFQICIHPVVLGKGLPLFDKINDRTVFKLSKTKHFKEGAVLHYYSKN